MAKPARRLVRRGRDPARLPHPAAATRWQIIILGGGRSLRNLLRRSVGPPLRVRKSGRRNGPSPRPTGPLISGCAGRTEVPASACRMKRMVWLVLAAFCTAFVRVQPVEPAQHCHCACCCHCKVPGACGIPCAGAPAPAPVLCAAQERASVEAPAVRGAQPSEMASARFYAPFVEPAAVRLLFPASARAAPAARVPLFKAQCSFLI